MSLPREKWYKTVSKLYENSYVKGDSKKIIQDVKTQNYGKNYDKNISTDLEKTDQGLYSKYSVSQCWRNFKVTMFLMETPSYKQLLKLHMSYLIQKNENHMKNVLFWRPEGQWKP